MKIGTVKNLNDTRVVPVGARFGKLELLTNKAEIHKWESVRVRCDCGKEKNVRLYYLISDNERSRTRSCGCGAMKNVVTVDYGDHSYAISTACRLANVKQMSVYNRVSKTGCTYQEAFDYYVQLKANKSAAKNRVTTVDFV